MRPHFPQGWKGREGGREELQLQYHKAKPSELSCRYESRPSPGAWSRQRAGSKLVHIPRQRNRCCSLLRASHKITIYSFIFPQSLFLCSHISHTLRYCSKIIAVSINAEGTFCHPQRQGKPPHCQPRQRQQSPPFLSSAHSPSSQDFGPFAESKQLACTF